MNEDQCALGARARSGRDIALNYGEIVRVPA